MIDLVAGSIKEKSVIHRIGRDKSKTEYLVRKDSRLTLILVGCVTGNLVADVSVRLAEEGASADILGFITGRKHGTLQLNTLQKHEARETKSNLLVKSVLDDYSAVYYQGLIQVDRNAQRTDAYQRNENLMLSRNAICTTKPMLEINANDVRCTHGATVSPIGKEEIWYLTSRGISGESAGRLIVSGFLESTLNLISDINAREQTWRYLWQLL